MRGRGNVYLLFHLLFIDTAIPRITANGTHTATRLRAQNVEKAIYHFIAVAMPPLDDEHLLQTKLDSSYDKPYSSDNTATQLQYNTSSDFIYISLSGLPSSDLHIAEFMWHNTCNHFALLGSRATDTTPRLSRVADAACLAVRRPFTPGSGYLRFHRSLREG